MDNEGQSPAQAAKRKLTLDDIIPALEETIKVSIHARRGSDIEATGFALFSVPTAPDARKYRSMYSGGIQQKKERPTEANKFLIYKYFLRFQDIEVPWNEEGYSSEQEWFAESERGQYLAEFVLGRYLFLTTPDTEDIKE